MSMTFTRLMPRNNTDVLFFFVFSPVFQADPRFVWNKNLLDELIEHKVSYTLKQLRHHMVFWEYFLGF